jgi:hypothetical protein
MIHLEATMENSFIILEGKGPIPPLLNYLRVDKQE